jgi:hypothetical protein
MNIENSQIPKNPDEFFPWLKGLSEKLWEEIEIQKGIYGFQVQKGTKWLTGLSDSEILDFEEELGFIFPEIYKIFIKNMNGTDKPAINIYGNFESVTYSPNYYSFPRDLEIIKNNIQWIYEEFEIDEETVSREKIPHIIPIVGHRFLIADNCEENPILSMYGADSIPYSPNLESFLTKEILGKNVQSNFNSEVHVKFWLNEN